VEAADPAAAPAEASPPDEPAAVPAEGFALVLLSGRLDPAIRPDENQAEAAPSPEEERRRVLRRLADVPVRVQANLGTASLPLADLAALEPGDVIVLDRVLGESIDLAVQGRTIVRAKPVQTDGYYGVEVQDFRRYPRRQLDAEPSEVRAGAPETPPGA